MLKQLLVPGTIALAIVMAAIVWFLCDPHSKRKIKAAIAPIKNWRRKHFPLPREVAGVAVHLFDICDIGEEIDVHKDAHFGHRDYIVGAMRGDGLRLIDLKGINILDAKGKRMAIKEGASYRRERHIIRGQKEHVMEFLILDRIWNPDDPDQKLAESRGKITFLQLA